MLVGQVLTRLDFLHEDMSEVKVQLKDGGVVHADLKQRIETLETAKDKPPAWEKYSKEIGAALLFLATTYLTGSVDKALSVLERLRAVLGH